MSFAQEQRREKHIESAKEDLDRVLAPYRARQTKLREQIAASPVQIEDLQTQLDAVDAEIKQIIEASFWWQLYQKD
jgi:multidrug resistance efflux pump